jgi:hypothetical protein
MLVPKTTVHKNNFLLGWEDEIGTAGQVSAVQTESIPQAVRQRTNDQFRFRVDAPDTPHVFASA